MFGINMKKFVIFLGWFCIFNFVIMSILGFIDGFTGYVQNILITYGNVGTFLVLLIVLFATLFEKLPYTQRECVQTSKVKIFLLILGWYTILYYLVCFVLGATMEKSLAFTMEFIIPLRFIQLARVQRILRTVPITKATDST